jgi:hypothetical protein
MSIDNSCVLYEYDFYMNVIETCILPVDTSGMYRNSKNARLSINRETNNVIGRVYCNKDAEI